tara:strand:- start:235 stop:411 length:177 start_codon:yes stop_codon:yes gene_type:complete
MSHPDPHHDPDNVRTDDHPNAPKDISVTPRVMIWSLDFKSLLPAEWDLVNEGGKHEPS